MSDLLDLAIDVAAIGVGLLAIGYTLWRASVERRRAGPMPQRAARAWKWRIVLGLCSGSGVVCLGGYYLLRHVGVGGFDWLFILGFFGAVGFVVASVMLAELEGDRRARRHAPNDNTR